MCNTNKIEIHTKVLQIVQSVKKVGYDKNSVNIYCINEDSSISIRKEIPNIKLHDVKNADGSIIVYYKNTNFVNCNFVLKKNCIIIIMDSKYKINKLSILNNNGDSSICYIGNNFSCMGAEFRLWEYKNIYIGDDVMFSWNIMLFTSDGHTILDEYDSIINEPSDIIISDHVWIGHGVKILKGSFVNKNCIVGESSIISKKYPDKNVILSGIPARIIKTGVSWDRKRLFKQNNP